MVVCAPTVVVIVLLSMRCLVAVPPAIILSHVLLLSIIMYVMFCCSCCYSILIDALVIGSAIVFYPLISVVGFSPIPHVYSVSPDRSLQKHKWRRMAFQSFLE